jgi:hypothetical protein
MPQKVSKHVTLLWNKKYLLSQEVNLKGVGLHNGIIRVKIRQLFQFPLYCGNPVIVCSGAVKSG